MGVRLTAQAAGGGGDGRPRGCRQLGRADTAWVTTTTSSRWGFPLATWKRRLGGNFAQLREPESQPGCLPIHPLPAHQCWKVASHPPAPSRSEPGATLGISRPLIGGACPCPSPSRANPPLADSPAPTTLKGSAPGPSPGWGCALHGHMNWVCGGEAPTSPGVSVGRSQGSPSPA